VDLYRKIAWQKKRVAFLVIAVFSFLAVASWMGIDVQAQAPDLHAPSGSLTNNASRWSGLGNKPWTMTHTNRVSQTSAAKSSGSASGSSVSTSSASVPVFSGCPQIIDSTALLTNIINDVTEHTYSVGAGPVGSFADCTVTRNFAGPIQSIQVIIESGQADDIGYVGNTQVTDTKPMCAAIGEVTSPVDVTSQVTTNGNAATLTLRAQENCCCATGWGVATPIGRLNASLHWVVALLVPKVEIKRNNHFSNDNDLPDSPAIRAIFGGKRPKIDKLQEKTVNGDVFMAIPVELEANIKPPGQNLDLNDFGLRQTIILTVTRTRKDGTTNAEEFLINEGPAPANHLDKNGGGDTYFFFDAPGPSKTDTEKELNDNPDLQSISYKFEILTIPTYKGGDIKDNFEWSITIGAEKQGKKGKKIKWTGE